MSEQPSSSPVAQPSIQESRLWTWMIRAALLTGVALRFWQFISNPSIWVDEAAVARNVLDRTVSGLLTPLDYGQVAPPGFLLAVKGSSLVFGASEYALRLTPFVFGIASVGLFFVVAQSLLSRVATFVATAMFSTAIPLIFFSSNLKQYSGDVAMTLAVIAVSLRLLRSEAVTLRIALTSAVFAFAVLFFSQGAVFAVTVSGAIIFLNAVVHNRPDKWRRALLVASWAIGVVAIVAYGYSSMRPVDNVYMHLFWEPFFMPSALTKAPTWLWTTERAVFSVPLRPSAFDGSLHYAMPSFFVGCTLLGIATVLTRGRERGVLIVGPVLLALGAAATGAYPVGARISLFLVPLLLLTVVHALDSLGRLVAGQRIGQFACLLLLPFAFQTLFQLLPPRRPEHLRPVMQYVAGHWQSGDSMWVYYGAGQAFQYYRRSVSIRGDVQMGDCNRENPREYLRQIDVERGKRRVWILLAHTSAAFRFDERRLLLAYLDAMGKRLDLFRAPPDDQSPSVAMAFLYDLSSAQGLASVQADTFPITEKYTPLRWTCYGVMSPLLELNEVAAQAVLALSRH